MKKTIAGIVLLALPLITWAQASVEAVKLLKEVKTKTEAYTDQTISFTNTLDAPGKKGGPRVKRSSKGKVTVVGDSYRLELNGQILFMSGSQLYIVNPDDEEITARTLTGPSGQFSPSVLLSKYENGSNFAWAGQEVKNGKTIKYVRMKPKASEEVREIVIGIDMSTKRLHSYQEFGLNNVITTLLVDSYVVNNKVNKTVVTFNKASYPGFDYIESKGK